MGAEFDVYVRRNTWLYALDPRVKLALVAEAILFTFLWPSIGAAAAVTVACLALLWLAQVPAGRVIRFLRGIGPLLLMVFVLTALFADGPGEVLLRLGPLRVTTAALAQGALLASRLLALGLIFFFWLSTTDQGAMVRGFVALRMPYTWGLTVALALRYLPILAGLFEQVREAQQARGLDLAQERFWQRLAAYRPVLIATVISALRNGERLGWALEARALGVPGVRRSIFRPLRLRRADLAALSVLAIVLAAGLALRYLFNL
jgi:energy-coupling factor transport system permease protein